MSLNWNLTRVRDHKNLCFRTNDKGETEMNGLTHLLIFATMFVDIGKITEKTAHEFAVRLRMYENTYGPMLRSPEGKEPRYITEEEVRKHIGLETNVFPMKTRKQYLKKVGELLARDAERELDHERGEERERIKRQGAGKEGAEFQFDAVAGEGRIGKA